MAKLIEKYYIKLVGFRFGISEMKVKRQLRSECFPKISVAENTYNLDFLYTLDLKNYLLKKIRQPRSGVTCSDLDFLKKHLDSIRN